MKILFLHIGDAHFTQNTDYNSSQISNITKILNSYHDLHDVIVVFSGDLANEGYEDQIETGRKFIDELLSSIKKSCDNIVGPKFYIVPGNHDVEIDETLDHAGVKKIIDSGKEIPQKSIDTEISKMSSFLKLANYYDCFTGEKTLFDRKLTEYGEYKVCIDLFNSALFSVKDSDNKGIHYLPKRVLSNFETDTKSDFSISVMHYSYHYFKNQIKNRLEQAILQNCSIAFFGHEHVKSSQNVEYNMEKATILCACGELCNEGDWSNSEFNTILLETETNIVDVYSYKWNSSENIYIGTLLQSCKEVKNPTSKDKIIPVPAFLDDFYKDKTNSVSGNFLHYFVFPRLKREEKNGIPPLEFVDEKVFIDEILSKKRVLVVGGNYSGKTTLLKYLFHELNNEKTPIYCQSSDFKTPNIKLMIKHRFEEIYGSEPEKYRKFEQKPKSKKIIIIDDIDNIDDKFFDVMVDEIEKYFDVIVLSSDRIIELDIVARTKRVFTKENVFFRYVIQPFFSDKRSALICKIVEKKIQKNPSEQSEITRLLVDSLGRQRNLFNLDPNFIIQFTEYFCSNVNEAKRNDGEVFGKVFEANLIKAVEPYAKKMSVDKLFIILDKVAYYIYHNPKSAYPISEVQIQNVISKYNEIYDNTVKSSDFIYIVSNSKILICNEEGNYYFSNKKVLAYFVSREIKRILSDEGDDTDLKHVIDLSCFEINADILIFLTYITENQRMLDAIINSAISLVRDWDEFKLDEGNVPFLSQTKNLGIGERVKRSKQQQEKDSVESERKQYEKNHDEGLSYVDYCESEANLISNQLSRSIWLLNVVSRCLPNFEHMMKKDKKELFVNLIYQMPNRIFFAWADLIEKHKTEIAQEIRDLLIRSSNPEKRMPASEIPKETDIISALRSQSLRVYLDIVDIAVSNSTRENSIQYLKKYPYASTSNYHLQQLMSLSHIGDYKNFEDEAKLLFDGCKNAVVKSLVQCIVNITLNNISEIDHQTSQRLENYYFPQPTNVYYRSKDYHKRLIVNRALVKKREK